jgi:TRAP-type C4-dicarboxylate transport system permease small subunit
MNIWRGSEQLIAKIAKVFNIIALVVLALSASMTFFDVLGRYFLNSPIPIAYSMTRTFQVAIIGLPLALIQLGKSHIRVDVVIDRIPRRPRAALEMVTVILAFVLFGIATWKAGEEALWKFQTGSYSQGVVNFPNWPMAGLVPIGLGCLCLVLLADIFRYGREAFGTTGEE